MLDGNTTVNSGPHRVGYCVGNDDLRVVTDQPKAQDQEQEQSDDEDTAYSTCGPPCAIFQMGFEYIEVNSLTGKKVAPGEHLEPWRGKPFFYSHHAIVRPAMPFNDADDVHQGKDEDDDIRLFDIFAT